jgi:RNA polymerase sigma-70 factor (ECF subfamily)
VIRDDFESLYAAHSPLVWFLIRRSGSRDADADDLFVESWETIFAALPSFCGRAKISTWIGSIVRNTCVDHFRRNRRYAPAEGDPLEMIERGMDPDLFPPGFLPPRRSPGEEASRREVQELVRTALRGLPPERKLIVEKWMDGFDYREIAEILKASGNARADKNFVGKQLYLAKIALLPILKGSGAYSPRDFRE